MTFVEIAIFAVVLAGSISTLIVLFARYNGAQNKNNTLEVKEEKASVADEDA